MIFRFHSYLHVCMWSQQHASYHSGKISQVEDVVGLRWGWKEAVHGVLIDCHGGLNHDLA